jgi:hypothetical protein
MRMARALPLHTLRRQVKTKQRESWSSCTAPNPQWSPTDIATGLHPIKRVHEHSLAQPRALLRPRDVTANRCSDAWHVAWRAHIHSPQLKMAAMRIGVTGECITEAHAALGTQQADVAATHGRVFGPALAKASRAPSLSATHVAAPASLSISSMALSV